MDRPIDAGFQKRQRVKRIGKVGIVLMVVGAMFIWLPGWIAPSVARHRMQTGRVETGRVEATITASGTVVPEFEHVMSCPIRSRVLRILKHPGEKLVKGEAILDLDRNEPMLMLKKLDEELALKGNAQARLKIELERNLNDLESQWQVKKLELRYLEAESGKHLKMFERGLIAKDVLSQSQLGVEKAKIEVQRLVEAIENARKSLDAQLDGLALEIKILKNQRMDVQRQLALAETRADRDGVLTWVIPDEGAAVGQGEVIARIADLSSFRVEARISDVHASRLSVGMPVKVQTRDHDLRGTVSGILPTVEDGIVTFLATLEEKSNPLLRSNLRVDVYPVLDARNDVLRIQRGPFINGGTGVHNVFVIRGDVAVKTPVQIGLSGYAFFEVLAGLDEGDEVILSDMTDYHHMQEVQVK